MLCRGCGFAEGSPGIPVNPGGVLDQEGTAHCSQLRAALFWCKDPHLWGKGTAMGEHHSVGDSPSSLLFGHFTV